MTPRPRDFYGKEVADAIQKACEELQVPQEELDIEVVETGSSGIFGLIRKKAQIKVVIKGPEADVSSEADVVSAEQKKPKTTTKKVPAQPKLPVEAAEQIQAAQVKSEGTVQPSTAAKDGLKKPLESYDDEDDFEDDDALSNETEEAESKGEQQLPEEAIACIGEELTSILKLMGYPSSVNVTAEGTSVLCHVGEEYQQVLTGQDGKTLDSLQYLLRKIVVRKVPHRLRLTIDIGNYREQRLADLKERAAELAESVKNDGKTQVIPSLSPSERRVVHMSLQDDKDIRSRSVGEGLFKKILIYKPGKSGRGGGRKRNSSKNRRNNSNRRKNE